MSWGRIINPTLAADQQGAVNYLLLDGAGDTTTTPKISAYDLTDEAEIVAHVASDDYTHTNNQLVVGNWQRAYGLLILTTGKVAMLLYNAAHGYAGKTSSVALSVTDGDPIWIKATYLGSTGHVKFYTSSNGTSWSQLGSTQTGAPASLYTGASYLHGIFTGSQDSAGNPFKGKIYRTIVRDGIDGTAVYDADFTGATPGAASITEGSSNAATVTLVGDAEIIAG
jgi:hypothetical protein